MKRTSNTRRLAGVLLCGLLLGACATPPQTRTLLAQPATDLPAAVELSDTPFYPQQRYQCGPAALATVLGAQGVDVAPEALVDAVYVPALHGSLPEEIALKELEDNKGKQFDPKVVDVFLKIYPELKRKGIIHHA